MKKFDGDIVEDQAGIRADDVGKPPAGIATLSIGHDEMSFGFALNVINDVGGAERDIQIGYIVLMEKSGAVGGDAYAENADVSIFKDETVVRLLGDGNGV